MPRQARIVIPGNPHHITQRGNYRQNVFDNENNYKQYSEWINEYALGNGVEILAYCLMSNHVHFIAIPRKEHSLSRLFNNTHMRYSQYINRQRGVKGHLWQGRFYSCILGETHLYRAIRYVENNPVRAKIEAEAWKYRWSSAADHALERYTSLIGLKPLKIIEDWKGYLKADDVEMTGDIRLKTERGLVVGSEKFINKLERSLKRSLKCLNQGRPKKVKQKRSLSP